MVGKIGFGRTLAVRPHEIFHTGYLSTPRRGTLAQLVEHWIEDPGVPCSSQGGAPKWNAKNQDVPVPSR